MHKKLYSLTFSLLSLAIVILCVAFLATPDAAFAASLDIVGDRFGISIPQDNPLFRLNNMAPGDSESSTVTVSNIGDSAFSFSIKSRKESGDMLLFQNLILTIAKSDGTASYYSGPLADLKNVDLGSIRQGGAEKLALKIYFPAELGNEYQGKTLSVEFTFTAYMDEGSISIDDEDVPIAPVVSPSPVPATNPTGPVVADDSIPMTGESASGTSKIVVLLMVLIVLKIGYDFARRRSWPR